MPDISMCPSFDCPIRFTCYRNPASGTEPTERRQSWSAFQWRKTDVGGIVVCGDYISTHPKTEDRTDER